MIRFLLKLIICVLLAGGAGTAYLAMRSGDPLYSFYEWISPARFQQYDPLIRAVAAEHHLDPSDPRYVPRAAVRGFGVRRPSSPPNWADLEPTAQ